MLEKGGISSFQMGLMLYPAVLASGFLVLPTLTAQYAQNDLWLTGLLAAVAGVIAVYTATRLHEFYPGQTIIQYSVEILGKVPGKILGLWIIFYNLHTAGAITRQYADFVTGNFLFKTPVMVIMVTLMFLCTIAVRGGVEVLARSNVLFFPVFIFPIFFMLLLIPDLDPKAILPVLSHGLTPVLKGSFSMMGWLSEFFLMSFLLPSVTDPQKGRKWGYISLVIIVLLLTYSNLMALFLLGPDLGNKLYPLLVVFRYVSIGTFLENLEAFLLGMWVVGHFLQISLYVYAATLSITQYFRVADYRSVVFPIGLFCLVLGIWDLPNFSVFAYWIKTAVPFHIMTTYLLMPLFLLFVAVLRRRKKKHEHN
ncbi:MULTISPECIES: GerAB/ArcD/ProY family transporter [unclassified Paenibacillus]|uniref:GerAB/ArcD/ProY family transporter n=1 Tax=unclassified Paenibacillus TaxID=185978 RepID=UPI0008385A49|nr:MULTISPECIES: endospore germination permease [unclassified Paenibacillus]NWL89117.1 spore gernimation protein [Paenibacillus sp. 79R4]